MAAKRGRVKLGHQSPNTTRVYNAANRVKNIKMGVDYKINRVNAAVAGHARTAGPTRARKVKGSR